MANVKINNKDNVQTNTVVYSGNSVPSALADKPYYLNSDQFFALLKVTFDDSYGSATPWHPEDLYVNVVSVLEIITNTLSNTMRIKDGREPIGIKESHS